MASGRIPPHLVYGRKNRTPNQIFITLLTAAISTILQLILICQLMLFIQGELSDPKPIRTPNVILTLNLSDRHIPHDMILMTIIPFPHFFFCLSCFSCLKSNVTRVCLCCLQPFKSFEIIIWTNISFLCLSDAEYPASLSCDHWLSDVILLSLHLLISFTLLIFAWGNQEMRFFRIPLSLSVSLSLTENCRTSPGAK